MRKLLIAALALLALAAWAQPDPNQPQTGVKNPLPALNAQDQLIRQVSNYVMSRPTIDVKSTPQGLLVLRNGVLAKYDGRATPATQVELFGPLPAAPADAGIDAQRPYALEIVKRAMPGVMLPLGNELIAVVGNQFFRVDLTTMTVKTAKPLELGDAALRNPAALLAPQTLEVVGRTLYLVRGDQVLLVNIDTGAMLGNGMLPETMRMKMLPEVYRRPPGAGNNGGGPGGIFNQPGDGGAAAAPGRAQTTCIGVIRHIQDGGANYWAIDANNGQRYLLAGGKLNELMAIPNIDGARVRIRGTLDNRPEASKVGNGTLTVMGFEALGAAK